MGIDSISSFNFNYGGRNTLGYSQINPFNAQGAVDVKPKQYEGSASAAAPMAGMPYSADVYEQANQIASLFGSDKDPVINQAGHQGRTTNPFSASVEAWSANGAAPVNDGSGFYDGELAKNFDRIG